MGIRETLRLDPSVTSATHRIKEAHSVDLAGRSIDFPAGTLNQYVLSMANREELNRALTWNGAFTGNFTKDVETYPRICPGRYLSLQVTKAIVNHAISSAPTNSA